MRCKKCGAELPDGARFCYMCASPVEQDAAGAAAAAGAEDVREGSEVASEAAPDNGAEPVAAAGAGAEPAATADAADAVASAPAAADAGAEPAEKPFSATSDVEKNMASIPAPVKLEGSVPIGAVPFVPMAPAPRGAYLQRRATPVRGGRPGANSAPTTASGYSTAGWPQDSAWSLEGRLPDDPQKMIERRNESDDPIGSFKTKFKGAFASWGSNASARDEKKRVEREAREAALRVEQAADQQRVREQQEKARRERQEREMEALREAYASQRRSKAPGSTGEVPQVAEQAASPSETVAAAPVDVPTPEPEAAESAAAMTTPMPAAPAPEEPLPVGGSEAQEPAPADETRAVSPLPDPVLSEASYPADEPAPLTFDRSDFSGLWGSEAEQQQDDFGAQSTRDLAGARSAYEAAFETSEGMAPAVKPSRSAGASPRVRKNPAVAIVLGIVVVAAIAAFAFAHALGGSSDTPDPVLKPSQEQGPVQEETTEETKEEETKTAEPEVRATVEEYSWDELSQIAALISAANGDASGLEIAKKYNLCAADGRLDGTQAKTLTAGGVTLRMRVAGFRQDTKADGSGLAGITFISDTSVGSREMNSGSATDWGAATLRSWLNGEFVAELPAELQAKLVSVAKVTNSYSSVGEQETTQDKVWLASYSELVGELDASCNRYSAYLPEGAQYQLFADAGISWHEGGDALIVQGDCANWWTRSPDPTNSGLYIAPRNSDGYPGYARNAALSGEIGVVPAFCL